MAVHRLQQFFGDDLEETWDSIRSVPGAFGNITVGVLKQVRLLDYFAFAFVVAGLLWLVGGHFILNEHQTVLPLLAILPAALWFGAGVIGGFVFHVGAIGPRSLRYWESYALILLFGFFGTISLRMAIDPRDRRVYRSTATGPDL